MDDPASGLLPLGLLSMAAVLKEAGHRVSVIHLGRFSRRDAIEVLSEGDPDVVGFSCFTFQRNRTFELARRLRERCGPERPRILVGGPHASPLASEILLRYPWIDGVARGEAEETVLQLAAQLEQGEGLRGIPGLIVRDGTGGIDAPQARPLIENVDALPSIAAADLTILGVDRLLQLRHLITARGCPCRCTFCSAPQLWGGRTRSLSVERVLAEATVLRRRYGLLYLSFRDDTFTADPAWTRFFSEAVIASELDILWDCQSSVSRLDPATVALMRTAGCVQIQLGVESGSDAVLRILAKPFNRSHLTSALEACRRVGMLLSFYVITGVPGERTQDIRQTERLVAQSRPASLVVSRLAAYPDTPIASDLAPSVWFEDDRESFFLREDPSALAHTARLRALADAVAGREPYSLGELKRAAAFLNEAPPAMLAVARLQEEAGLVKQAGQTYATILDQRPGYPWAELSLGELLLETGEPRQAADRFERVIGAVPGWPYPLDRYGWALVRLGNEAEGRALITRAQQMQPLVAPPPPPGC